ncbi:MAG: chemotaxis protein CheB [Parvularcula sp.]|jgi:two-component system chemotaxis response regulator CheB|nr:chemotaxis protein CheB [Parvularcula sp.]
MPQTLDTIVIGGSAGAFTSLKSLLSNLPNDLPATIFVVLHAGTGNRLRTSELLQPHCSLPLKVAVDGMVPAPGEVIFAPQDFHMLIGENHLHLRRGPRENNFRPAIDPLFRSAAVNRGTRAAGIVLSGLLDDGSDGLAAIAAVGGLRFVEDPAAADYPDMPAQALKAAPDAERCDPRTLAERIVEVAGMTVAPAAPAPESIRLELMIAGLENSSMATAEKLGELSPFNCPDCNGVLWEIKEGHIRRYRCHTGHAYGAESLSAAQEEALERTLYNTLRAHRGRAELLSRMAEDAPNAFTAQRLLKRAEECQQDAEIIEDVLKNRSRTIL